MDWSSSLDKDLHDTTQTQSNLRDILQGYGRSQAAHQQRTKSNTPIPDDGLVGSDGRSVQLDGLGTAVQSHGALGDTNVNSSGTHLTILTELAGSDEGDGQDNLLVGLVVRHNSDVGVRQTGHVTKLYVRKLTKVAWICPQ